MSKRYALEREKAIDEILKKRLSPITKNELADVLAVNTRTIQRDIRNLRDFYFLPVLSIKGEGYYYDEQGKTKEFPKVNQKLSEDEIKALIMAYRLSAAIPQKTLKQNIRKIFDKISHFIDFDLIHMEGCISLKNVRYYKVKSHIFKTVIESLRLSQKARIHYLSNHSSQSSDRIIQPIHLIIYMGNWHLLAYCENKADIRVFALSRIQKIELLREKAKKAFDTQEIKDMIHRSYGIFLGPNQIKIELKFSADVYGLVKDQVWTFNQHMTESDRGEITLSFMAADLTEVKGDVLSFGEHVEVLEPEALREIVQKSIQRMNLIYKK